VLKVKYWEVAGDSVRLDYVEKLLKEMGLSEVCKVDLKEGTIRVSVRYDPFYAEKARIRRLIHLVDSDELREQLNHLLKMMEDASVYTTVVVAEIPGAAWRLKTHLEMISKRVDDARSRAPGIKAMMKKVDSYIKEYLRVRSKNVE
jgi:hypothetical protein